MIDPQVFSYQFLIFSKDISNQLLLISPVEEIRAHEMKSRIERGFPSNLWYPLGSPKQCTVTL